ncbi:unnamed protein product [Ambrosiozyma monospora]|uniref:Unnamed protein product n=1 Tax=Ambrosiozyma monospora TaxID=43982 RepID=A0ACB5TRW2_AMBMO|nr:unnamed protein product [Ambrosiozyma monospora]
MLVKDVDFVMGCSLGKFEIGLLLFYYLLKFVNYNVSLTTDSKDQKEIGVEKFEFLRDVLQLNMFMNSALNLNKDSSLLEFTQVGKGDGADQGVDAQDDNTQLLKIQRLKLYWDFRILCQLFQTTFSLDTPISNFSSTSCSQTSSSSTTSTVLQGKRVTQMPKGLESIKLINNDIMITLGLFKLFELIPTNFMLLVQHNNVDELSKLDEKLSRWNDEALKDLGNDENIVVLNKLKTYYYYLKILINLNESTTNAASTIVSTADKTEKTTTETAKGDNADKNNNNSKSKSKLNEACHGFIDVAYTLTFSKSTDITPTNLESLSLSSFNFHMMSLISIIQLKDSTSQDRDLHNKLTKMIQIYQLLCLEKLVDPNIALLCKFIKDNVVLKVFIDDCYGGVSDDSLLFGRGLTRGVGNGTGDDLKLFSCHFHN